MLKIKRVYEKPTAEDGVRILVDRLWPRGLTKKAANIDYWFKDIAPSNELRNLFHAGKFDFNEFQNRYLIELSEYEKVKNNEDNILKNLNEDNSSNKDNILKNLPDGSNSLAKIVFFANKDENITLLFSLKDEVNNNAAVLRKYIFKKKGFE